MKTAHALALVALLCFAGCAMRPVIGQGDDCASKDNTTCTSYQEDTDTGCCWSMTNDACEATSDTQAASPFDGICIPRTVIDDGIKTEETAACPAANGTLCNIGSDTEPAGCTISQCFVSIPPLQEDLATPNWTTALVGDEASSSIAACFRGLNIKVEGGEAGKTFVFDAGVPVAIALAKDQSLVLEAPAGEPKAGFRVSQLNITSGGNATASYNTVQIDGTEKTEDLVWDEVDDVVNPTGYPRGILTSFTITNKGDDVLNIERIKYNVC